MHVGIKAHLTRTFERGDDHAWILSVLQLSRGRSVDGHPGTPRLGPRVLVIVQPRVQFHPLCLVIIINEYHVFQNEF